MISHRLKTAQNADLIYVFDNGRIVEKGIDKVRRKSKKK
jgi:ABC-type multidrug transport system fused ATPase/permease subunit